MDRGFVILAMALTTVVAQACNSPVDVGGLRSGGERASSNTSTSGAGSSAAGDNGAACRSPPANIDASCFASCCTPTGAEEAYTTVERVYAWVEGRWQICTGLAHWQQQGAPADAIGVEFGPGSSKPVPSGTATVGGNMYFLVQGPSGPVRGMGFAYQWTYDVSAEGGSFYQFVMHQAPNESTEGSGLKYYPCPTELDILALGYDNGSVLVPFY